MNATQPVIPAVIDHRNMERLLSALLDEPEFRIGPNGYKPTGDEWYRSKVWLEFPTGELAKDGLTTLALVGRANPEHAALTGDEGFNAQGLEGKVRIRKDLFGALMNLRDLLPQHRGRIVTR